MHKSHSPLANITPPTAVLFPVPHPHRPHTQTTKHGGSGFGGNWLIVSGHCMLDPFDNRSSQIPYSLYSCFYLAMHLCFATWFLLINVEHWCTAVSVVYSSCISGPCFQLHYSLVLSAAHAFIVDMDYLWWILTECAFTYTSDTLRVSHCSSSTNVTSQAQAHALYLPPALTFIFTDFSMSGLWPYFLILFSLIS